MPFHTSCVELIRRRRERDPLPGTGLMQSEGEWSARGDALSTNLSELLLRFRDTSATPRGLDIGCQDGALTDQIQAKTGFEWLGIDPIISAERISGGGLRLLPGRADRIPFPDSYFDCVLLANVFEHIAPSARESSLREIRRVLTSRGIVVGQLPNPYFPIESHSRLPFMGWLPRGLQQRYWTLSRVPWELDFYVVTLRHLERCARNTGLEVEFKRPYNYPAEAIPQRVRAIAKVLAPLMRIYPWSWQFVLRRAEPWLH